MSVNTAYRLLAPFAVGIVTAACENNTLVQQIPDQRVTYPSIHHPPDNQPTPERIELGKLLFNDVRLSSDGTVSCASCHRENHAFADQVSVSTGTHGRLGRSNAPSIVYAGFEPVLLRGSTVPTLEMQVLVPIQESVEFDRNILELVRVLQEDATYQNLSMIAYNRPFDAWVLTRAISNYERSLPQFNSRYDQFIANPLGKGLTEQELSGQRVFQAQCASCHSGILFTNHEGIRIPDSVTLNDPSLMPKTTTLKVPSLRNISRTWPYLHSGSVTSLQEVIDGYRKGAWVHCKIDERCRAITLSDADVQAITAFLETLSDYTGGH